MSSTRFFCAILASVILAAAGLALAHTSPRRAPRPSHLADSARPTQLPPIMLWAWERPEDLSTINPNTAGIAFLARTVFLAGDTVSVRPRLQPLRLALGTQVVAVVRIEARIEASRAIESRMPAQGQCPHGPSGAGARACAPLFTPSSLSPKQLTEAARAVAAAAQLPGLSGLQIDFDASASQREFYRQLIAQVRDEIPARLPLSITALASWCAGDDWLLGLPIDDAVPMLFRMGADTGEISLHLNSGGDFRAPVCRQSLGVSTDESPPNLPAGRRLYIFSPRAWTSGTTPLATQMVRP
jgi:hypothetical protein